MQGVVQAVRFTVVVLAVGLPCFASAQTLPRDPLDQLEDQRRQQAIERNAQTPPVRIDLAPGASLQALPADPRSIDESTPRFRIDVIEVLGATVLPASAIDTVVAPYRGLELGSKRINALIYRLTEAYLNAGYVGARVYLPEQSKLAEGRLVVQIVEGRVERVEPANAPLPDVVGRPLRLGDLEQGVEQINRLRSIKAQASVAPGSVPGDSVVQLQERRDRAWRLTAGLDNNGQPSTGRTRVQAGGDVENMLGFYEALALNLVQTDRTHAAVMTASVPDGYATWSGSAAYSAYDVPLTNQARLSGRTDAFALTYDRVVFRDRTIKAAINVGVNRHHGAREVESIALASQTLTTLRVGTNAIRREASAYQSIDIGIAQGTKLLGANDDPNGLMRGDPHAQFTKFDMAIGVGGAFAPQWNWRSSVTAQTSGVGLYGTEQIAAGGMYSVRGYGESVAVGDRGAVMRNEVIWSALPQLDAFTFADGAGLRSINATKTQWLASIGAGLRLRLASFNFELIYGRPKQACCDGLDDSGRVHVLLSAAL